MKGHQTHTSHDVMSVVVPSSVCLHLNAVNDKSSFYLTMPGSSSRLADVAFRLSVYGFSQSGSPSFPVGCYYLHQSNERAG